MSHNTEKNPDNVARGLKASIHNNNVSDEAKQNAAQRLEQMGAEVPADYLPSGETDNQELNSNRQRGYKSVLSRDDVSDEAKQHAREMLKGHANVEHHENADTDKVHGGEANRVLGGYKATLKNPNVSDAAKEHAQQVLDEAYD